MDFSKFNFLAKAIAACDHTKYTLNQARQFHDLAMQYYEKNMYKEAEQNLHYAWQKCTQYMDQDLALSSRILNHIAIVYHSLNRLDNLETIYQKILADCKLVSRKYSPISRQYSPNAATILNNLGELYVSQYRYEEAHRVYSDALNIRLDYGSLDQSEISLLFYNIGKLNYHEHQYGLALSHCQEAKSIEQKLGSNSIKLVCIADTMVKTHYAEKWPQLGKPLIAEALQLVAKLSLTDYLAMGTILNNWAYLYYTIKDYTYAKYLRKAAYELTSKSSPEHSQIANLSCNKALVKFSKKLRGNDEPDQEVLQ